MNELFKRDYKRFSKKDWSTIEGYLRVIKNHGLLFVYLGRKAYNNKFFKLLLYHYGNKYGLEISFKNIGKGLLLAHAFNITINPSAKLGEDVTIFKGATIGSIRSGVRKGAPKIGNRVTICINAFVAGNINIGDDVLIAANSFVNFDVPSNSIVIGNPAFIKQKENPSNDYL